MRLWLITFLLVLTCGCRAINPMTGIANSHVEANAPGGELFDKYLKRDLTEYFCHGREGCRVEYEYLRRGATQSGVSYPKYYLWAKCFSKEQLKLEGAVRVAAVDQQVFQVTNFLSEQQIVASPDEVRQIFPVALVDKIVEKSKH